MANSSPLLGQGGRGNLAPCKLHYEQSPLKITRSQGLFFYDDTNTRYLDCASRVSNVGHCHPEVVRATCQQWATSSVWSPAQEEYSRQLLATLPAHFDTCLFVDSGAEANDVAVQLARRYTGKPGVAVVKGSFHGWTDTLVHLSQHFLNIRQTEMKPWVCTVPCPQLRSAEEDIKAAKKVMASAEGQIGCFICEPILDVCGMIVPPASWLQEIYRFIQSAGGVTIADEIITGMGRTGHFWACQAVGVMPDIITVGKPMGNGYPMAAVLTSRRIAGGAEEMLGGSLDHRSTGIARTCPPLAAAVGLAVLKVLRDEELLQNAAVQGQRLKEKLSILKQKSRYIGGVRGRGLLLGVEVTTGSGDPDPILAEKLTYRLKDRGVLMMIGGLQQNILTIAPPLNIGPEGVDMIVSALEAALRDTELMESEELFSILKGPAQPVLKSSSSGEESNGCSLYNFYDTLD